MRGSPPKTSRSEGNAGGCARIGYPGRMSKFHEFEMESITGDPVSFGQFAGKAALVVNVASQ